MVITQTKPSNKFISFFFGLAGAVLFVLCDSYLVPGTLKRSRRQAEFEDVSSSPTELIFFPNMFCTFYLYGFPFLLVFLFCIRPFLSLQVRVLLVSYCYFVLFVAVVPIFFFGLTIAMLLNSRATVLFVPGTLMPGIRYFICFLLFVWD